MVFVLEQRGQINIGHIGPRMAQQSGHSEVGIQSTHTAADQLRVRLCRKGVTKPVKGQGRAGLYLDVVSMLYDEKL